MYRILARNISDKGDSGCDVLILDDETREVVYFVSSDFDLLCKFVNFLDKSREDVLCYTSGPNHALFSVVGHRSLGVVRANEVVRLRNTGYLVGKYAVSGVEDELMKEICDPSIVLRYNMYAIIDTDGRLWYLDPKSCTSVRLSEICRSVVRNAIIAIQRKTDYYLDDGLDFVHSYCFQLQAGVGGMSLPTVYGEGKYKNL